VVIADSGFVGSVQEAVHAFAVSTVEKLELPDTVLVCIPVQRLLAELRDALWRNLEARMEINELWHRDLLEWGCPPVSATAAANAIRSVHALPTQSKDDIDPIGRYSSSPGKGDGR
jgi:hypothetical protein